MAGKDDPEYFAKILVIIGGAIGTYAGIDMLISLDWWGIGVLLLGLAALASAVKPGRPIPLNIVITVPIGIIMVVLTWLVWTIAGGILVIIGGILLAID
ncbi:MAG: hypothetical protein ACOC44_10805 [Promethearchaeia archaeon]